MKACYLSGIDEAGKVKEDVLSSNKLERKAFIGLYKPILPLRTKYDLLVAFLSKLQLKVLPSKMDLA